MNRWKSLARSAIALPLALACAAATANGTGLPPPLEPYEARYQVTDGSSRVGEARFGLAPASEGWRYYSRVEAEGLYALLLGKVEDTAWLELHAGELRPVRFIHDEDGGDDDVRIAFDWSAGRAVVQLDDGERTVALDPGTHDQFSAMLQVMQAFAAGRARLQLPSIDDDGKAEPLTFERAGETRIETPLGTFDTVHVRRVRKNSRRETESWLAPELGWIPVRIDQRKSGELVARMELSGFNGEQADLSVDSPR